MNGLSDSLNNSPFGNMNTTGNGIYGANFGNTINGMSMDNDVYFNTIRGNNRLASDSGSTYTSPQKQLEEVKVNNKFSNGPSGNSNFNR